MKILSEKTALERLKKIKTDYQNHIKINYEHKAKDCLTCDVQGICCTDAHFVNVHITRLEACAIQKSLEKLGEEKQREIYKRVEDTIEKYDLNTSDDTFTQTFACPLFEKQMGCLVHKDAKPIPCIQHACYENKADLPPDELHIEAQEKVERLNKQTYGKNARWLPLPIWISLLKPDGQD